MVFDINHKEVKIGSWVKVISIDYNFVSSLPIHDAEQIKLMLNQVLQVTEIAHNKALVNLQPLPEKYRYNYFSLALSSEEMELVNRQ
jgi:hypothetical protein